MPETWGKPKVRSIRRPPPPAWAKAVVRLAMVIGIVGLAVVIFGAAMATGWLERYGLRSPDTAGLGGTGRIAASGGGTAGRSGANAITSGAAAILAALRGVAAPSRAVAPPASREIDTRGIPEFPLKAAWTYAVTSEVQLSLSSDGKYVLASRSYDRDDGWRNLGFAVLDDRGTLLWQKEIVDAFLRYGGSALGSDGLIYFSGVYYSDPGTLYVYQPSGTRVYTKEIRSEQQIIATERPDRLGVVEPRRSRFVILDAAGEELFSRPLAAGDRVTYTPGSGRFAILEGGAATLLDLDGGAVTRVQLTGPPKDIAVTRDGTTFAATRDGAVFAVTVGGGAPAVLLFDAKGAKVAESPLEGKGKFGLAFAPDGQTLVVFDVGPRGGGLQLLDAATGKEKWQLTLLPPPGRKVAIKGVTFLPNRQGLLVDCVESFSSPEYGEDRALVLVNLAGTAVSRVQLGRNVDARLAAGGMRLVTGTNNLMAEHSDEISNTISYYRLDAFVAAGQK